MKRHKNKIITFAVIVAVLATAWFYGSNYSDTTPPPIPSVTLTVRVDTLLNNMNMLNREKHEIVPEDGVIFPVTEVTVYEGESVFNVLQREMRRAQIHMAFRNTPIYNAAYIEAINNIYEFDAGELSGWMYSVNGVFPNVGVSQYILQHGDVIEWHFTLELGRDLGAELSGGGQNDE
jgi:hypothetical protein